MEMQKGKIMYRTFHRIENESNNDNDIVKAKVVMFLPYVDEFWDYLQFFFIFVRWKFPRISCHDFEELESFYNLEKLWFMEKNLKIYKF